MKHFLAGNYIAFDTETTGVDLWHGCKPFGFSFCNELGETTYFEFDVDPHTREPIIDATAQKALRQMKALLEDTAVTKVMHNAKFDIRAMELAYGIKIAGPGGWVGSGGKFDETMFMAFNCNTLEPSLALKRLAKKYDVMDASDQDLLQKCVLRARRRAKKLGWKIGCREIMEAEGDHRSKAEPYADYWLPRAMRRFYPEFVTAEEAKLCELYAVKDAVRTMALALFYKELMKELAVEGIYNLEMSLWPVIYGMETRGVCTNRSTLAKQMEESRQVMRQVYKELEKQTWVGFRPKAANDCRKLFYEILDLPITKWTSGGKHGNKQPAVSKFVIVDHVENPVIRNLAIWKANHTAFTTFFSKFDQLSVPDPLNPGGTALHCEYRQCGPATGRLSSANPNMQNVMTPENTMAVHPLHVRPAFEPRPGYWWLCVDYEGMEVRMFALLSREPTMLKAIYEGRSIHDEMTDTIWGGKGNHEAIRQAIRALSLDGTGIGTSPQVDQLWREWGVTRQNVLTMPMSRKEDLADIWLASHNYSQVRAQSAIGRKNSKTTIKSLTFLKIYGGGAEKATLLLRVSRDEAARTLSLYDRKFPRISEYSHELMREARANGFIRSLWGRRLVIDQDRVYRCVNYIVQGSSADLMKDGLVRVNRYFRETGVDAHILMTVHDEIISEVRIEELTKRLIRDKCDIMSDTGGRLDMPMTVEPKVVTHNWSVKKKVCYN